MYLHVFYLHIGVCLYIFIYSCDERNRKKKVDGVVVGYMGKLGQGR